jgi:hypothetical protein
MVLNHCLSRCFKTRFTVQFKLWNLKGGNSKIQGIFPSKKRVPNLKWLIIFCNLDFAKIGSTRWKEDTLSFLLVYGWAEKQWFFAVSDLKNFCHFYTTQKQPYFKGKWMLFVCLMLICPHSLQSWRNRLDPLERGDSQLSFGVWVHEKTRIFGDFRPKKFLLSLFYW